MQSNLDRISLVRQTLCHRMSSDVRPVIAERLRPLVFEAHEKHRFRDLWVLSIPYCAAIGVDASIQWLLQVLNCQSDIPPPTFALLSLELAQKLGTQAKLEDCTLWLDRADSSFRSCKHSFGSIEVRRLRLHYGLSKPSNLLSELVDITASYINANNPLKVLQSAISPLTVASRVGNMRTYVNLQEIFHQVCNNVGITHERLLLEIQLLASLNAGSGHFGKVVELGTGLYAECLDRKYWTLAYQVGKVLSLAYSQRKNQDESERFARDIYDIALREDLILKIEAAHHLAIVRSWRECSLGSDKIRLFNEIAQFLEVKIDANAQAEEVELSCDILCFIAGLHFQISRLTSKDILEAVRNGEDAIRRAKDLAGSLAGSTKLLILGKCDELTITQLLFEGKNSADNDMEPKAIRICDDLIDAYGLEDLNFHKAFKYQFRAACHTQIYQKSRDLKKRLSSLVSAESDLQSAVQLFGKDALHQPLLVAQHALSRIHVEAWDLKLLPSAEVFKSLVLLDAIAEGLRRELSALGSLDALLQKQQFGASSELEDLYAWAIAISIRDKDLENVWTWSQKRKSRSLSDMLGLGVIVPKSVKHSISLEPTANELFERLLSFEATLKTTPENERGYLRQHIIDTETEMRQYPVFKEFAALRDGTIGSVSQIESLKAKDLTERDVFFIDFVAYRDALHLAVISSCNTHDQRQIVNLAMSVSAVREWRTQFFATSKGREEILRRDSVNNISRPMRTLDVLVQPLESITNPGDLLIFSLTSCLHDIPLHVLKIRDENVGQDVPLIARNPIMYTPSKSVLDACLSRSLNDDKATKYVFLAAYDKEKESEMIYNQMEELAGSAQNEVICGGDLTRDAFGHAIEDARLVHYHGHCKFSADNALRQGLILSPQGSIKSAREDMQIAPDILSEVQEQSLDPITDQELPSTLISEAALNKLERESAEDTEQLLFAKAEADPDLTVEHIFNLVLASPLVTLIACESASQTISAGDEPLGLIAGLLCAGAASVIGTSWRIPSGIGRAFSNVFYRELEAAEGDLVDLAVTLQEAVLTLRDDKSLSAPYYWGGFCLYGSWLFRK